MSATRSKRLGSISNPKPAVNATNIPVRYLTGTGYGSLIQYKR